MKDVYIVMSETGEYADNDCNIEAEEFETHRAIFLNEYGKKQQLEIPEVPQFVADWYEENKDSLDYMIYEMCANLKHKSTDKFEQWFGEAKNNSITTLIHMKNGYTVAKEKRFYLKNKLTGLYLAIDSSTYIEIEEKWLDAKRITSYKPFFTQSQIDGMETGSYEQIEVEE